MRFSMSNIICKLDGLEVQLFDSKYSENVAHWLSHNRQEFFFTTSSLPYPCTTEKFINYYNVINLNRVFTNFIVYLIFQK